MNPFVDKAFAFGARHRWAIGCAALLVTAAGVGAWMTSAPPAPSFAAVQARWTPSEAYLLDRHGQVIDQRRMDFSVRRLEWTPLDAVSPALIAAVVDGEDRRFWQHSGVDWVALFGAVRDQLFSGRRRGGSTITMQVAALVEPRVRAGASAGAWHRKLAQMRMARAIEREWSKEQILEAYLNLLGYRGELQGIAATSYGLAGKLPSGLTVPESLVLAALLPAPGASAERVISRACSRAAARRLDVQCESIRAAAAQMLNGRALAQAGSNPHEVHLAPHLARRLLRKAGDRVRTTLDARVQQLAVNVMHQHLAGLAAQNVRDGAMLVVENETGNVLAYVGSGGPHSTAREVDGVLARRQAGSTLKPFLYELALEQRYLTAASLLNDSPLTLDTASGIYLPQNYDREFKGLVSVRTALGNSLNIPAIRALMLVGVEPFRARLYSLGYEGIREPGEFYGYSLALGSAEVSLWEQVRAYRALAQGGRLSSLHVQQTTDVTGEALLDPNASFIIADILADRAARTVTFGLSSHLDTPFWAAVKTGTSKDMRDNWCIGFSRHFTVGVWVGNFEGDAMRDVSGVTGAAPAWQQMMLALHEKLPSASPAMPAGVRSEMTHFTPAVEPARRELFLQDGAPVRLVDEPEPAKQNIVAANEMARIASPANGMVIALDPDIPPAYQRVPLAARGATEDMVLKLNGSALGPAARGVMWAPTPGSHVLALEDGAGRVIDSARFIVR
jgi:penicillin-binding protein 1C